MIIDEFIAYLKTEIKYLCAEIKIKVLLCPNQKLCASKYLKTSMEELQTHPFQYISTEAIILGQLKTIAQNELSMDRTFDMRIVRTNCDETFDRNIRLELILHPPTDWSNKSCQPDYLFSMAV